MLLSELEMFCEELKRSTSLYNKVSRKNTAWETKAALLSFLTELSSVAKAESSGFCFLNKGSDCLCS